MTFRARILLACLTVAAVPLLILAAGARHVIREQLTADYRERVDAAADALIHDIETRARTIDSRLGTIATGAVEDPTFRAALFEDATSAAVLDFAQHAMRAAGLDFLLLLDSNDVVLSSGHFRSEYGRSIDADHVFGPRSSVGAGPVAITADGAAGDFLAFVRGHAFTLGGRAYRLVGGIEIDSSFAEPAGVGNEGVVITRVQDGVERYPGPAVADFTRRVSIPHIDGARVGSIDWHFAVPASQAQHAIARIDRWFMIALAAALLLAYIVARIAAANVTRPLERLARDASRVELTRYDVRLASPRRDEVGSLARLLDRMVQRLRTTARQLRETERRATVGDMARQVNHDIRNGLLPIRNVIRHLGEVAEQSPDELATVFNERAGTLRGGIGYLENLATNYARLTPRIERQQCDVNAVLEALRDAVADERVALEPQRPLPTAVADPVALRRVVENLMVNALESLPDGRGSVVIRTAESTGDIGRHVLITIADTGSGIAPDALDRIFDDFHTTKERGTGLGLSIVRRLVTDMGGRVAVRSAPDRGTTFTIELPVDA